MDDDATLSDDSELRMQAVNPSNPFFDPITVVGPGRCGTSAVAGVLHHLGIFMGKSFVEADESNVYGHWEDPEFVELNQQFAMLNSISETEWTKGIKSIVAERQSRHVRWGWKDPRTCHLLPQYIALFNKPKFVRCRRRAAEIEASLVNAYGKRGFTWEYAEKFRKARESALDQHLVGQDVLEINYRDLKQDKRSTIRKLVDFIELTDVKDETFQTAADFIRFEG